MIKKIFFTAILLVIFCSPVFIQAATFYKCTDKRGNDTLSNYPLGGQSCTAIHTYDEKTGPQEQKPARPVKPPTEDMTPITVMGNSVLVPVTLTYGRNKIEVQLLMDTGATGTTIHTEVAERLSIDMTKARKMKGKVVGGGMIEAGMVRISSLTVGPHTFLNHNIFVVSHEGPPVKFDGLLGMDLLQQFKFKLDFQQQAIIWE